MEDVSVAIVQKNGRKKTYRFNKIPVENRSSVESELQGYMNDLESFMLQLQREEKKRLKTQAKEWWNKRVKEKQEKALSFNCKCGILLGAGIDVASGEPLALTLSEIIQQGNDHHKWFTEWLEGIKKEVKNLIIARFGESNLTDEISPTAEQIVDYKSLEDLIAWYLFSIAWMEEASRGNRDTKNEMIRNYKEQVEELLRDLHAMQPDKWNIITKNGPG